MSFIASLFSKDEREGLSKRPGIRGWLYPLWLMVLALLLCLGFWQLDRAQQKRDWQSEQTAEVLQEPGNARIEDALSIRQWVPVRIRGEWIEREPLFLDNRTLNGRVGYEVLLPARLNGGDIVLVNTGFVEAPALRENKPEVVIPESGWFKGVVGRPVQPFILGQEKDAEWRVQRLDTDHASEIWGVQLKPWVLWLSEESGGSSVPRVPGEGVMPPERHIGYAVQWFALALTLVVIAGVLEWKSRGRSL